MKKLIHLCIMMVMLFMTSSCGKDECPTCDEGKLVSISFILKEPFYVSDPTSVYVYSGDVLFNHYEFTGKTQIVELGVGTYELYVFNGVESLPLIPESRAALVDGVPPLRYRVFNGFEVKPVSGDVIFVNIQ